MIRILLALSLFLTTVAASAEETVSEHLQNISVTIRSGYGQGSGVLFTRGDRTFVWTAGHVVKNLRKTRTVIVDGSELTVVEFKDAQLVTEFREGSRRIGEQKMDCRVIRYSDARQGEDLALLEVRKRNFSTESVVFDTGIPVISDELFHVGSLHGQVGANSLTTGVVSQIGRVLDLGANGKVFDQVSTPGFPGSSGGGVFNKGDGTCIGLLVRGTGETFCLIVPVRRIRAWAEQASITWALDRSVPLPSDAELKALPIEDVGVEFGGLDESTWNHPFMLGEDYEGCHLGDLDCP
jgi:hypothetical protein